MGSKVSNNIDIKLAVFNELSSAMRHQSQAEYVYTGSAVASYGGICLGVAALPSESPVRIISVGVAIFALVLSFAIYRAISHNCAIYKKIQESRVKVVRSLATEDSDFIPAVWLAAPNPIGVKRAYTILSVATLGAVVFALERAFAS